jgi:hypothetical protein
MKLANVALATILTLACNLSLWADDTKPFVSKDHQFRVKSSAPLESWNAKGVTGFKTPGELSAAKNSYSVLVLSGKDFNTRYSTYKFLVDHQFFGSKPLVKETKFAGYPSLDFEALTEKGFPCLGKIIKTPSKTYVVMGAGHETSATRDFVQSFQLTSVAQTACNGKCESGCKTKCDQSCKQACGEKSKSECTEESCKH